MTQLQLFDDPTGPVGIDDDTRRALLLAHEVWPRGGWSTSDSVAGAVALLSDGVVVLRIDDVAVWARGKMLDHEVITTTAELAASLLAERWPSVETMETWR